MKKSLLWMLAFLITVAAAYYQRKTGPTYPKQFDAEINNTAYKLKLIRSIGLDERSEVKFAIRDTTVTARLFYRRFRSDDEYRMSVFSYKVYPVNSFVMNKIFKMTEEDGFFAYLPKQPPAGKLEYFVEITDSGGTKTFFRENPVVVRYKGSVPGYILLPHVLLMFLAMLFSTFTGLLCIARVLPFRKYAIWTLGLLTAGGMILGPVVQKFAFGAFWTGVPFGWDLTDNKTLIAFIFWVLAVVANREKERPLFALLAAAILLLVYSIPHSMLGSEFDYETGNLIQGITLILLLKFSENS